MRIAGKQLPNGLIYDPTTGDLLGYKNFVTGDDVALPHSRVAALASASGVVVVDLNLGQHFTLALTEAVTGWTFVNLPVSGMAKRISIRITQTAEDDVAVAWPASFVWAGGTPGAVSAVADAIDVLEIVTFDNGVTWNVVSLAKAFA